MGSRGANLNPASAVESTAAGAALNLTLCRHVEFLTAGTVQVQRGRCADRIPRTADQGAFRLTECRGCHGRFAFHGGSEGREAGSLNRRGVAAVFSGPQSPAVPIARGRKIFSRNHCRRILRNRLAGIPCPRSLRGVGGNRERVSVAVVQVCPRLVGVPFHRVRLSCGVSGKEAGGMVLNCCSSDQRPAKPAGGCGMFR